jgi:hypothetical protein
LSCKRLAVAQGVMVEASIGDLPDCNKWNVDASAMIDESDGKGGTMVRIVSVAAADDFENDFINKNPLSSTKYQNFKAVMSLFFYP